MRSTQARQLLAELQDQARPAKARYDRWYRRAIWFEGLTLEVASNHRSIIACLNNRYALDARSHGRGASRITLTRNHDRYLLTSPKATLLLRQGQRRLYFAYRSGESSSFWAGSWTGYPDPVDGKAIPPGVLRLLDRTIVAEFVRRLPKLLFLHATAVSLANGTTCLLVGASGSGKTTLAQAVAAQGGQIVADDICPVGADLRPRPFPRRSPTRPGSQALLARLNVATKAPENTAKLRRITNIIVLEGFSPHGKARLGALDERLRVITSALVGLPPKPAVVSRLVTRLATNAHTVHIKPARRKLLATLRIIDSSIAEAARKKVLLC